MHFYKNHLTTISLFSSAILCVACGDGNPTLENQTQSFQSSFTSSLTIEEQSTNSSKKYEIPSNSSNEKDSILTYSVITKLGNTLETSTQNASTRYPRLNQVMRFALDSNGTSLSLEIAYNPLLKQATSFTLTKNRINSDNTEETFFCRQKDSTLKDKCAGSTVSYDPSTGAVDVSFTHSHFESNDPSKSVFILDGTLQGKLSIAPQTIQNIPKTSHGTVTIDGKTHEIIAAVNNPEQIIGAQRFNTGISALLDDGTNISFSKDNNGLYSQYLDSRKDFLNAQPVDVKQLTYTGLKAASQFILQPTVFNFSKFGDEPQHSPVTISTTVDAPLPQQTLTINPAPSQSPAADQNNPWYSSGSIFNRSSIPSDFTIHLINHNTVTIESQDITATIQDKKLKSVQLNTLVPDTGSSTITRLVLLDYQCGNGASACQGVTVEPNGFRVKFNNTVLTNTSTENNTSDYPLPPSIKLNGGLVYLGR